MFAIRMQWYVNNNALFFWLIFFNTSNKILQLHVDAHVQEKAEEKEVDFFSEHENFSSPDITQQLPKVRLFLFICSYSLRFYFLCTGEALFRSVICFRCRMQSYPTQVAQIFSLKMAQM